MTTKTPWIKIDDASFQEGYKAGLRGHSGPVPGHVDGYSFAAGLVEGKAQRMLEGSITKNNAEILFD